MQVFSSRASCLFSHATNDVPKCCWNQARSHIRRANAKCIGCRFSFLCRDRGIGLVIYQNSGMLSRIPRWHPRVRTIVLFRYWTNGPIYLHKLNHVGIWSIHMYAILITVPLEGQDEESSRPQQYLLYSRPLINTNDDGDEAMTLWWNRFLAWYSKHWYM